MNESPATTGRFELTLHEPRLRWHPKPTVVVDGVAQPAQWGTRSWKVPGTGTVTVRIFLFNRAWTFGEAEFTVEPVDPAAAAGSGAAGAVPAFAYRAPLLPWGRGRLAVGSAPQRRQP